MKYTKPALSFDQQAQRLLDRGLIVSDKETLKRLARALGTITGCLPRNPVEYDGLPVQLARLPDLEMKANR